MRQQTKTRRGTQGPCLSEDDLYCYVTQSEGERSPKDIESHLVTCSDCREELAGLLEVLHPDDAESSELDAISPEEIEETLMLIKRASHSDQMRRAHARAWYPWAASAAAAVLLVVAGGLWLLLFLQKQKSEIFYAQGQAALRDAYDPQSPNGLRLELPFPGSNTMRSSPKDEEALNTAENSFYQALAVREGMVEARLGLGFVSLNRGRYSKAQAEFQRVLETSGNNIRAILGRGVAQFEEGLASKDPVQRLSLLEKALADFDGILKHNPELNEALYNKALTLYELGRHKQAEQEILRYLDRDPRSIWSERLRKIQMRMGATRAEAFERVINRAARERDLQALKNLAELVPYSMPAAIRGALEKSLKFEGLSSRNTEPDAACLRWAAGIMESEYRSVTGDLSYTRLLEFYAGLSPPQRRTKKFLDAQFQKVIELQSAGKLQAALRATPSLIEDYQNLGDHWDLVDLYHLRGNCLYFGRADFKNAITEYSRMLHSAELSGATDLIAKSLGALSSVYSEQRLYGEALAGLGRMKTLASKYRLDTWMAYAHQYLGSVYERLNRLDESLQEHLSALSLAYRLENVQQVVVTLEQMAQVLARQQRFGEAHNFYDQALRAQEYFAREGGNQFTFAQECGKLNILCKQGYLALRTRDLAEAESLFKRVLTSSHSGMRELIARTRIGLAQVFLAGGKIEDAEKELRSCLSIIASHEFPELQWQASYLNGNLLKLKGDTGLAMAQYERSIRVLEGMRTAIPTSELRQSFLSHRFDPYQEIVALLFHSLGDRKRAAEFAERSKSMTLREHLAVQTASLASSLWEKTPAKLGGFPRSLPDSFALVEYFFARDELFIFVHNRAGLSASSQKLSRQTVDQEIREFIESTSKGDTRSSELLSRRLHDELIGPILKQLETWHVQSLVVLPDGLLHLLPFGGLKDAHGRYLLEKYALAYAPSRSVFEYCLSMDKGNACSANSVLLLDGSSRLPGAADELAHLAKLYHTRARLVGPNDLASGSTTFADHEIIHFSGHATTFEGKPSLVFASPRGTTYLDAATIGTWKLARNRLVTLAGCNTGIGPLEDGEIPWGLVPALLTAGAPAIITSLLPVDDAATRRITSRFYDLLVTGSISKSKALQLAQLSLLKEPGAGNHVNTVPWLPFVLIGDPR